MTDFNYMNSFTFGGVNSAEYSVIVTAYPAEQLPERDISTESIPGRNGDLTYDNGRYTNTERTYTCAMICRPDEDMRAKLHEFLGALKALTGYQRLEDTYLPNTYCLAVLQGSVAASSVAEEAGEFTITFNRKPQWYYNAAETLTLTEPGIVANPTLFPALPCINIYGAGSGTLTIGGVTVEILELEDVLTIDCELMDAYRQVGEAAAENKNSTISAVEFPTLKPGENTVSWTGDIESVEILPRWWTL